MSTVTNVKAVKPIEIISNGDRTNATVRLYGETHTIGNSLRYILARNPETDYVGYSVPHPGEPYLNVRLQTRGTPVDTLLKDSLSTLGDICDTVMATFEEELEKHDSMQD